jgi:hypothetical protein
MISITLPYPSMDFVPLDVLKADDLDKVVANINAIVNAINAYQLPEPIVASGTVSLSAEASADATASIIIPNQSSTGYKVFLASANPNLRVNAANKATSSFSIVAENPTEEAITTTCDYLVIKA